jgi:hypothetical protein
MKESYDRFSSDVLGHNLERNLSLVENSHGPGNVIVVCGTEVDRSYWHQRLTLTKSELFRRDGSTSITSVSESVPKGNFLGTLAAWGAFRSNVSTDGEQNPSSVTFMTMLFGQGTRLSPFTQALGNGKPRFLTPYKSPALGVYLTIGELAALYSGLLVHHLERRGFRGCLVKWGDEVIIPSVDWNSLDDDYSDVDAIRFVWQATPTSELAKQKEWLLFEEETNDMVAQIQRQPIEHLRPRIERLNRGRQNRVAVNLGSFAVSSDFLDIATRELHEDVGSAERAVDWDPAVWIALSCRDKEEWDREVEREAAIGQSDLRQVETRYPDFFDRVSRVRQVFERRKGRKLRIKALDFGDPLWLDLGQHVALRANLEQLLEDSPRAGLLRRLFNVPIERDENGNTMVNSTVATGARVRNSLIIDSRIGPESVVERGVIVDSSCARAVMPEGGVVLFSCVESLEFSGPHCVIFQSAAESVSLPAGGRHSTVVTLDGIYQMTANENLASYKGDNYAKPIFGNPISFEEAGRLTERIDPGTLARMRSQAARLHCLAP